MDSSLSAKCFLYRFVSCVFITDRHAMVLIVTQLNSPGKYTEDRINHIWSW